jgi:hypothetical protein
LIALTAATDKPVRRSLANAALVCAALVLALPAAAAPRSAELPEILLSARSSVPGCVTPQRLMGYLAARHRDLPARWREIARLYQVHGVALGVRWDYAFFQMLLETNYLTFRRGDGFPGDVKPQQNNFAGLGATGGGVAGDSFADVSSGVLAHFQHLLAYAGRRVVAPIGARTRAKQDDIIEASLALNRPVRFSDLARRWARDRNYGASLAAVAAGFGETYCAEARGEMAAAAGHADPQAPHPASAAASAGAAPCDVWQASYGGDVTLLIRSMDGNRIRYTVLQVDARLEQPQAKAFMRDYAKDGTTIARFPTGNDALQRAFSLCRDR